MLSSKLQRYQALTPNGMMQLFQETLQESRLPPALGFLRTDVMSCVMMDCVPQWYMFFKVSKVTVS